MQYVSGQNELLFYRVDAHQILELHKQTMMGEIQGIDPDRLLNTPVDDLVTYFSDKFRIEVPVLRRDKALLDEPRESTIEMHDYGRQIYVPATSLKLTVPFEGEKDMFFVRPSTFNFNPPRAVISDSAVVLHLTFRSSEQERVKSTLNRTLDEIEQYLDWHRPTIDTFNANLAAEAKQAIETRRERLLRDRHLVSGLGFAMKPRADAPITYAAPEVRRKIEPRLPSTSSTPFKPEPVLQEAHYQHILNL